MTSIQVSHYIRGDHVLVGGAASAMSLRDIAPDVGGFPCPESGENPWESMTPYGSVDLRGQFPLHRNRCTMVGVNDAYDSFTAMAYPQEMNSPLRTSELFGHANESGVKVQGVNKLVHIQPVPGHTQDFVNSYLNDGNRQDFYVHQF